MYLSFFFIWSKADCKKTVKLITLFQHRVEVCGLSGHLAKEGCLKIKQWVTRKGKTTFICPYHKTVNLDQTDLANGIFITHPVRAPVTELYARKTVPGTFGSVH